MEVRLSNQQFYPIDQWAAPRKVSKLLKDKGKSKFVETPACSDIFEAFWGNTWACINVHGDE